MRQLALVVSHYEYILLGLKDAARRRKSTAAVVLTFHSKLVPVEHTSSFLKTMTSTTNATISLERQTKAASGSVGEPRHNRRS